MNFIDNLWGKRKFWSKFSNEIGAKYIKGDFIVSDRVVKSNNGWVIVLFASDAIPYPYKEKGRFSGRSTGPAGYISQTYITSPFLNTSRFNFTIWNKRSLGALFISKDNFIETGYQDLDAKFDFETNNKDLLVKMLSNTNIRQLLNFQTDFDFSINNYQDGFKVENPEEYLDELVYYKVHLVKDCVSLKNTFDLFYFILEELKQLDIAKPIDESRLTYPLLRNLI